MVNKDSIESLSQTIPKWYLRYAGLITIGLFSISIFIGNIIKIPRTLTAIGEIELKIDMSDSSIIRISPSTDKQLVNNFAWVAKGVPIIVKEVSEQKRDTLYAKCGGIFFCTELEGDKKYCKVLDDSIITSITFQVSKAEKILLKKQDSIRLKVVESDKIYTAPFLAKVVKDTDSVQNNESVVRLEFKNQKIKQTYFRKGNSLIAQSTAQIEYENTSLVKYLFNNLFKKW